MSIFIESELKKKDFYNDSFVNGELSCHSNYPLLALSYYSEKQGAYLSIYDDENIWPSSEIISQDLISSSSSISCLEWHSNKRLLVVGMKNGSLRLKTESLTQIIESPHRGHAIQIFLWSDFRLISSDESGSLVGWQLRDSQITVVFHHDVQESLYSIVFLDFPKDDIESIAKAAVSGDETALDLMCNSSWRKENESLDVIAGSKTGRLLRFDSSGHIQDILQMEEPLKKLLFVKGKKILIVVSESMTLIQYKVNDKMEEMTELYKIKMSTLKGEVSSTLCQLIDTESVAIYSSNQLRIWNIQNNDHTILPFPKEYSHAHFPVISSLDYSVTKSLLAAGTKEGLLFLWTKNPKWKLVSQISLASKVPVLLIKWAFHLLVVSFESTTFLLREQKRVFSYNKNIFALQTNSSSLVIQFGKLSREEKIRSTFSLSGLYIFDTILVLWGKFYVVIYQIQRDMGDCLLVGEYESSEITRIVCSEKCIYSLEGSLIVIRSFFGTLKQSLSLSSVGKSLYLSNDNILVCGTVDGIVFLWDLRKRDARSLGSPLNVKNVVKDLRELSDVQINSKGTHLSFTYISSSCSSDLLNLIIFELETHVVIYNYNTENSINNDGYDSLVSHVWDNYHSHLLLLCLYNKYGVSAVLTLFVTENDGVLLHEKITFENEEFCGLLALELPYFVILIETQNSELSFERRTIRDFVGLENADKETIEAVLSFSFHLTLGHLDEAFFSIQRVTNSKVWENMARICVSTQRVDVALICLGHMKNGVGAYKLSKVLESSETSLDVKTAYLAIILGMREEAECLLLQSESYCLLNKYYQDSSEWSKALAIAETHDRLHARNTYYNYAKYLEGEGEISKALLYFEKSETHRFEIPQCLFQDLNTLESYIQTSEDKYFKRWWAQYNESTGEMETALQYYEMAEDMLSLVRVYCYCDNLEKAGQIANASGDFAACYHLARQYENFDNISQAIYFFKKAGAFANAIRICKEHEITEELWSLGLFGSSSQKLEVAKYFENEKSFESIEKAIKLYEKAGYLGKACDLAFKSNQYNAIGSIISNFSEKTDPKLIQRTAAFFLENEQFEKAVELFSSTSRYKEALDLILKHNIRVDEELEKQLSSSNVFDNEKEKMTFYQELAQLTYRQGSYQLSTKLWTQCGNRLNAMKALLKSGDTKKIIYFANVCREQEIYVLAGNYLQSLDWRNNSNIMSNIIRCYNKGKAFDNLGMFYKALADLEIDDYQNYEKALSAFSKALDCFSAETQNGVREQEEKRKKEREIISQKISVIFKFLQSAKYMKTEPEKGIELSKCLLEEEKECGVRFGDIFALLTEHYVSNSNFKEAFSTIEAMKFRIPNVNLTYYLSRQTLASIDEALGSSLVASSESGADDDS